MVWSWNGLHTRKDTNTADCGGVLIRNVSFIFFRLKIKKGGMEPPLALIAHTIVVSSPRSCDAVEPTCFFPFTLITFPGT